MVMQATTSSERAVPKPVAATCDVLVIGGGPAGSSMSAFLSRKGWKVVLLEKQHHPRFHIGESLLPLNMPIIDRLGVRQQVEAIGMLKPGAEFNYAGYKPAVYYFSNALDKNFPIAYQVRRSEFDNILLRNSARLGTDVREGMRVTDIEFRPGQLTRVYADDESGAQHLWETKYLVDASGRDTFLANRQKDLRTLRTALSEKDFETIRTLGHRMRGDGGGYGFNAISTIGGVMELAAGRRDEPAIQRQTAELEDFLTRVHIVYRS